MTLPIICAVTVEEYSVFTVGCFALRISVFAGYAIFLKTSLEEIEELDPRWRRSEINSKEVLQQTDI